VATWAPVLERRGRRLDADVDGDPLVLGSAATLAQVLDVLLDNAVRHARDVALDAGLEDAGLDDAGLGDGGVVVAVADEGTGIPAGEEVAVFERATGAAPAWAWRWRASSWRPRAAGWCWRRPVPPASSWCWRLPGPRPGRRPVDRIVVSG